jgi:hypothetical protein
MFNTTIRLGNDAMQDAADVAQALRAIAVRLDAGATSGPVVDVNGSTVGTFTLDHTA